MSNRKIVFDTSFLLQLFELFSFDEFIEMFKDYELLIPKSVYNELVRLSKSLKYKKSSKVGYVLKVLERCPFKIIESISDTPDEDVLLIAEKLHAVLATGDRLLRRKARLYNIKVLYFRNRYPYID